MYRSFLEPSMDFGGAAVLVTGGTGSFGRRFVRLMLERHAPRRLVILSRDELKQSEMREELEGRFDAGTVRRLRFFIGDVRDRARMELAMREIDYVVHAAALKQVPTAEYNPSECLHTNIGGAENVVWAALRNRVKKVVALSTDKACNPINLYGASKLASDKTFIAANNLAGGLGTRFSVVRYGNVVGSRGSVVPFFRRLAEKRAESVPITDRRMTRFWITLDQGVQFVMSCFALMRGGEIFVPKIPSMRIVDLARAMLPWAEQRVIGIRPGEKLHETMISEDDAYITLDLGDRYVIEPAFAEWERKSFAEDGARRVPDRFAYTSDRNEEWLDADGLQRLLRESAA